MVKFQQIPDHIAHALLAFAERRNIGKSVEIEGEAYTLDFISPRDRKNCEEFC